MAPYHYSLKGILLDITCSDSQQEHVDERRFPNYRGKHRDGRKREHRQQFNDSPISKLWRKKIGTELATKFLLLPGNGAYTILLSSKPLLIPSLVDYCLVNFPKGYMLYSDEIRDNHVVHRYDPYLYSMCSLLTISYLLLIYPFPKVIIINSAPQRNLCLTLPGSLLVCRQGVVNAGIAAQAESFRAKSTKSWKLASTK